MTTFNKHPLFIVDAFSSNPFSGNPAAILVLDDIHDYPDSTYQNLAAEMNLSETAIVAPSENGQFRLRWFSPTNEIHFCGHATLATSHALFVHMGHLLPDGATTVTYDTLYGRLDVEKTDGSVYKMRFPRGEPEPVALQDKTRDGILERLGLDPKDNPVEAIRLCKRTKKLMVHFKKLDSVLNARPNSDALVQFDFDDNPVLKEYVRGIIINTAFKSQDKDRLPVSHSGYDFVTRYFSPWNGIPEDPVNGSGHTVQAAYWSQYLNKEELQSYQASSRGGELMMQMNHDGKTLNLCGHASSVLEGQVKLPTPSQQ